MSDERRLDRALRSLDYMGTRVTGHEGSGWTEVEMPPRARGYRTCACGHRTDIGGSEEALREWSAHLRDVVYDGAEVVTATGERI